MQVTQYQMARHPVGPPTTDDFAAAPVDLGSRPASAVRVKLNALSLDPYIRMRMAGRYIADNLKPGDPITSEAICTVIESNTSALPPGSTVATMVPWQAVADVDPARCRPVNLGDMPVRYGLGVLGMPGLTAYAGVTRLLKPGPDDVIVVSAASGPVGATVGQLCKAAGARVIGIAGGAEKCAWVKDVARFDDCIDYRQEDLATGLARLCPEGPTGYFDNVGGQMLRTVLGKLRPGGRIVLCGIIADYNEPEVAAGPTSMEIMGARAHIMGLIVFDHEDLRPEWERVGAEMIRAGTLVTREEIVSGLAAAPAAFARLMRGENQGKVLVEV
jgi:NADPH-dependent curcumin reductase